MTDRWYSIVEYARAFSLSDMTVRRRIKNGKLIAELKDGKYYIKIPNQAEKSTPSEFAYENRDEILIEREKKNQVKTPYGVRPTFPEKSYLSQVSEKGKLCKELDRGQEKVLADFISYCQQLIGKVEERENLLKDSLNNKIRFLEEKLEKRDIEVRQLKQQLEDLELLINMFEKKLVRD